MEITVRELIVGECHTIATLALDKDDRADAFLKKLARSNSNAVKSLKTCMKTISSVHVLRNNKKFKPVGNSVYEIKVPGIRLYCFHDQIEGHPAKLIIATNGGKKNTPKEQDSDIRRAKEIRKRYRKAKEDPETTLEYIELPNED